MSQQCCPVKSLCIDPANPVQNFSSEAPDVQLFIGFNTGWDNSMGGYNTPPIGGLWDSSGCEYTCVSTISQADADQCAANQQLACADGTWQRPPGTPYQNFLNDSENCVSFCPDGSPFNFTIPAGSILAGSRAIADQIAGSFACTNAALRKICLSGITPTEVCAGSAYSGTIVASGGLASPTSNSWAVVAGSIPPGLSFPGISGRTLVISGTPTTGGNYAFTMRITAPNGDFMQKQYALCVADVSPGALPNGATLVPYSQALSSCGTAPLNWQVTSGSLPPGLSLNQSTGVISGTPTVGGTYNFVITLQTSAT